MILPNPFRAAKKLGKGVGSVLFGSRDHRDDRRDHRDDRRERGLFPDQARENPLNYLDPRCCGHLRVHGLRARVLIIDRLTKRWNCFAFFYVYFYVYFPGENC